jgi:hypothetical protein
MVEDVYVVGVAQFVQQSAVEVPLGGGSILEVDK